MRAYEDGVDVPVSDSAPFSYQSDDEYEEPQSPWTDESDEWSEQEAVGAEQEETWPSEEQSWDDDADDEWVFDGPSAEETQDDDGVVWEDTDDIHIGAANAPQDDDDFVGPEVELAGRRDVRPRAPRARSATAKRPPPNLDDRTVPPSRPQRARARPKSETVVHQSRPSTVRQPPAERPSGRFIRTQATIEQSQDAPPPTRRTPAPQTKRRASTRRSPAPSTAAASSYTSRRGRGRKLAMALIMALILGAGGWFGYRQLSGSDANGLAGGWQETFGLSSSNRTAADTPFQQTPSPEEAIADLPRESRSDGSINVQSLDIFSAGKGDATGSQAGGPLNPQYDPAIEKNDGPPMPKFKPRPGLQGLEGLSRSTATRFSDKEVVERDGGTEPSFFERFWSLFRSG